MENIYESYKQIKSLVEATTWVDLGWEVDNPDLKGYSVRDVRTKKTFPVVGTDDKGLNTDGLGYVRVGDDLVYSKKFELVDPKGIVVNVNKGGIEEAEMRIAPGRVAGEQVTNDRDIRQGDRVSWLGNDAYGKQTPFVGTVVNVEGDSLFVETDFGGNARVEKRVVKVLEYYEEDEAGEEETQPDPDNDAFITSNGFKLDVSISGKHIGTFRDEEEAEQAIKQWCEKYKYWPTVWFVDDHGGVDQYHPSYFTNESKINELHTQMFLEGMKAYRNGKGLQTNPYRSANAEEEDDFQVEQWDDGWEAAEEKDNRDSDEAFPKTNEALDINQKVRLDKELSKDQPELLKHAEKLGVLKKISDDGKNWEVDFDGETAQISHNLLHPVKERTEYEEPYGQMAFKPGDKVKVLLDQENDMWSEPGIIKTTTNDGLDVIVTLPTGDVTVKRGALMRA